MRFSEHMVDWVLCTVFFLCLNSSVLCQVCVSTPYLPQPKCLQGFVFLENTSWDMIISTATW